MTRHIAIFAACFLLGALATAILRTAGHDAYASAPAPALVAASEPTAAPAPAPAPPVAPKPVNTVCPICGMAVDPKIPPATYQGKAVGFGCRACPPKFAKEPELYGQAALQNKVVE